MERSAPVRQSWRTSRPRWPTLGHLDHLGGLGLKSWRQWEARRCWPEAAFSARHRLQAGANSLIQVVSAKLRPHS